MREAVLRVDCADMAAASRRADYRVSHPPEDVLTAAYVNRSDGYRRTETFTLPEPLPPTF